MNSHISCAPVESVEPAEEALRGRSRGQGGDGGSTLTCGGLAHRGALHLPGLSFKCLNVVSVRVAVHSAAYCLVAQSRVVLSTLKARVSEVVRSEDLLLGVDPCAGTGEAAGGLNASARRAPLRWVASRAGRSRWCFVRAVVGIWNQRE